MTRLLPLLAVLLLSSCAAAPTGFDRGDDDDATDEPSACDSVPHGLFVICPEPAIPRGVPLEGTFTSWSSSGGTFVTGGDSYELSGFVEDPGADGLPELASEPELVLQVEGICDDPDKGAVTVLVTRPDGGVVLLASTDDALTLGGFTVTSPSDTGTCAGIDRGGCWTAEHPKPVHFDDGETSWTSWQGPAVEQGPWRVTINVAFSGAGTVRCEDCCSTERLGWWLTESD